MDIGKRFYDARTKKHKSVRTVYDETKVPASSITMYENGERLPNMKNAQKLADYYGVNVLWLLGKSDSPSLDEDSQTVTRITGLSADAVRILQHYKNNHLIDTLNKIVESYDFERVIKWYKTAMIISQYCTENDKNTLIDDEAYQYMIEDTNGEAINNAWFPGESQIDMCLLRASNIMRDIFINIMKGDKDNGKRNEEN